MLLLIAAGSCFADGACTAATEYRPALCAPKLARPTAVHINKSGAKFSAADKDADCSGFTPTPVQIRRYFARAERLQDLRDGLHTLDWSPCYASGTLRLADGREAHWLVSQNQSGSLTFGGGEEVLLYCPACRVKPFAW